MTIPVMLFAALFTMDLGGRKVTRAIDRQQIVSIQITHGLQPFTPLQLCKELTEGVAQMNRVDLIKPFAQVGIRGRLGNTVQCLQIRLNQGLSLILIELQRGGILQTKYRQA